MKTAERDINRAVYAFKLVRDNGGFESLEGDINEFVKSLQGKPEKVLIVSIYNDKYEGWHPTLGEFKLVGAAKPAKYSEVNVELKIKTFAPLEFESVMVIPKE